MSNYGRRLLAACRACENGDHSSHVAEFTIGSVYDALCDCLGDCAERSAAWAALDAAPSVSPRLVPQPEKEGQRGTS